MLIPCASNKRICPRYSPEPYAGVGFLVLLSLSPKKSTYDPANALVHGKKMYSFMPGNQRERTYSPTGKQVCPVDGVQGKQPGQRNTRQALANKGYR